VGRWFGKSKRGLIFGIWNSHTSIGNIVGTLIAGHYVERDWSMSFIVPGFIMGVLGFVLFLFLVESPEIVGLNENGESEATGAERRGSYRRMESGRENDSGESDVDEADVGEQVSK
jgi:MFS transporter, OPA family, solute carrier family 37 (glycerol-3-phosphate transporter), member 1/2